MYFGAFEGRRAARGGPRRQVEGGGAGSPTSRKGACRLGDQMSSSTSPSRAAQCERTHARRRLRRPSHRSDAIRAQMVQRPCDARRACLGHVHVTSHVVHVPTCVPGHAHDACTRCADSVGTVEMHSADTCADGLLRASLRIWSSPYSAVGVGHPPRCAKHAVVSSGTAVLRLRSTTYRYSTVVRSRCCSCVVMILSTSHRVFTAVP